MRIFIIACLIVLSFGLMAKAQTVKTEFVTSNALNRANFHIAGKGSVSVFLPGEIMPGDLITGRIQLKASAAAGFSGMQLTLGGKATAVKAGLAEWSVPNDADPGVTLALENKKGETLARIALPLAEFRMQSGGKRGRDGGGIRVLPMELEDRGYSAVPNDFFDGIEVIAASPRQLVIFDSLILDTRPDPVLCCSEGGRHCGLTSCCDFIPSSSCTHCNVAGYDACIRDSGPPTPG